MIRNGEGSLEASAGRLSRALERLEARIEEFGARRVAPEQSDEGPMNALKADLRSARERERALEGAAAEASATLGRAAEQIRAALDDEALDVSSEPEAGAGPDLAEPDLNELSDDQTDLHQPRFSFRNQGA